MRIGQPPQPRDGELIPPTNEVNVTGWQRYLGVATQWRKDLQRHGDWEIASRGEMSAEIIDAIDECDETLSWGGRQLESAILFRDHPDTWLEVMSVKAASDHALSKASWRRFIDKHPDWLKDRHVPGVSKDRHTRCVTDRILDELAIETKSVDAWLDADYRTKEQIVADTLKAYDAIEADHQKRLAAEFDKQFSGSPDEFDSIVMEAAASEFDKMFS